ncbi:MAG: TIGR03936 family radical SAM-associated protein [Anaerolineaceae bacterium]|nr:TIGR03936 family radical SAM-associated protein [Anaerolineaceae bacterium]
MDSSTIRLRVTYAKFGDLRYTGNLDMQRLWERIFRRSRLPVAYSKGYHPQVRIQQACALPLGFSSTCELLDLWLESACELGEIVYVLQSASPPGIVIKTVEQVEMHAPPLQTQVIAATYRVFLLNPTADDRLPERISELLALERIPRIRRDKPYDLRPLIESLDYLPGTADGLLGLSMGLAAREGATGRPEEVLDALGLNPLEIRVERIDLLLK